MSGWEFYSIGLSYLLVGKVKSPGASPIPSFNRAYVAIFPFEIVAST